MMLRRMALLLFVLLTLGLISEACGPFFAEAVFVQATRPDGPYANYLKGNIGVPQPRYRMRHLVVAYDWLQGNGLSAGEQAQALALDAELYSPDAAPSTETTAPGLASWIAARQGAGVEGGPRDVPARSDQPGSGISAAQSIDIYRHVPGEDYQSFDNCLDDAFASAARTLLERKAAYAHDAAFADWVHGQDAVFANCSGSADALPASVAASAPHWLQQDRAYQTAAAKFYQEDYDGAIEQFRAIAADAGSPWQGTARYVSARAMIRRATVGQASELPPAAQAPRNAPYSKERSDALQAYQAVVAQKRIPRLTEARDALRALLADPSTERFHHSAAGLLDLVMLQVDPSAQAQTLMLRLTAANRAQTPGVFRQALIDIGYFPKAAEPEQGSVPGKAGPQNELLTWMRAMAAVDRSPSSESSFVLSSQVVAQSQASSLAAQRLVLAGWASHHTTPWLVAALNSVNPGDPAVEELLKAAAALPADSPAATAVNYQRLRLTTDPVLARAGLDTLLPALDKTQSRSTMNLFVRLRQRTSPTLSAFLADAGTLPAGVVVDSDEPDPPDTKPDPAALCRTNLSPAQTRLFDHDAASILNTRLPLRLLADAASSQALPANLRFQLAQATWTRAVLLGQVEIAKRMTPLLTGCYNAWKPWLAKYDAASTPRDRQAQGLLALMRFASTEPVVRDGEQRPDGFATYSAYRDNWWQGSRSPGASTNPNGSPATSDTGTSDAEPSTFFGMQPAARDQLPDPPFISPGDRAAAEREVTTLRAIPCASDYFASEALAWQKQNPADPRTPDILGFAERVVRSGCRTDATKELNHQLFTVVQAKYAGSEWASKYTTWE